MMKLRARNPMPLRDLAYQRYEQPRTPALARSWAIARTEFRRLLNNRAFLLLLAASWIPAIARALQIYAALSFPQGSDIFGVTPLTWFQFLKQQVYLLPVILVSLYVGAPAIANDSSSGALVIYLSKPVSIRDYLFGKALPVLGSVGFVTLAPALLLLFLHLVISGNLGLLRDSPWLPVAILAYGLWLTSYFGLTVLALSSLSRSGRVAGIGFVALALGSEVVVRGVLARFETGLSPTFLSITGAAVDSGHLFFGTVESGSTPLLSTVATAGMMVVSLLIMRRRLRSPEVVS